VTYWSWQSKHRVLSTLLIAAGIGVVGAVTSLAWHRWEWGCALSNGLSWFVAAILLGVVTDGLRIRHRRRTKPES